MKSDSRIAIAKEAFQRIIKGSERNIYKIKNQINETLMQRGIRPLSEDELLQVIRTCGWDI